MVNLINWKLKKLFDFGKTQDFFFCYTDVVRMIKEIRLTTSLGRCFITIEDSKSSKRYTISSVEEYINMLEDGFNDKMEL